MQLHKMIDVSLLNDACDDGDHHAGSQKVPKRIKYVYREHCLQDVSEKTYRSHYNLHYPCRNYDQRVEDDGSMMH